MEAAGIESARDYEMTFRRPRAQVARPRARLGTCTEQRRLFNGQFLYYNLPACRSCRKKFDSVVDVARQLNLSRSKIYGLIARGELTVHRLPAIRVSQEDLSEFLTTCRSQKSPRSGRRPVMIKLKHLR